MKVTGHCDGPICDSKAEIDVNHGKPTGWWTIRVTGSTILDGDQPTIKRVDHTTVLCNTCFQKLGVPINVG